MCVHVYERGVGCVHVCMSGGMGCVSVRVYERSMGCVHACMSGGVRGSARVSSLYIPVALSPREWHSLLRRNLGSQRLSLLPVQANAT